MSGELFDPGVPFTRKEALRHGVSDRVLRGPSFQRVFAGVYVAAAVEVTVAVRAQAALRLCPPGSYVSHFTAAELWELHPPAQELTHVSVARELLRPQCRGLRVHQVSRRAPVMVHRGVAVSTAVRAFAELATEVGLVDLVVMGDRLVRQWPVGQEQLTQLIRDWAGMGARLARQAAELVRSGVDSPMETRLRLLLVLAGLPEPEVNVVIYRPDGRWEIRIDLAYRRYKIMIEYDGRQHAETIAQWQRDIERRELLDSWGWRLIVVSAEGIYNNPGHTLSRVHQLLLERGVPGVPRRLSDDWRRYFPGR